MATVLSYINAADPQYPGVNNDILQAAPILLEIPEAMPDDDVAMYTFPAPGDSFLPPRSVQVYRHTGGDLTNGSGAATYVVSNGDTIILSVDAGDGTFVSVTHTLTGISAGAGTDDQISASINADAQRVNTLFGWIPLNQMVFAALGLTANSVTLFPIKPRGAVRVGGGTALAALPWPGTVADWKARTYVSQAVSVIAGGTGWSWSYAAATRILTLKNETGGAVNRVLAMVHR